ncbi:conserved hypothetical protein [Paraburkholderia tropica]|uniref:deazapurine DNA modification protein DpdA family protein n=1 Tax=Paraburkholderia tropica TaxID=92647 RepID=UPI001CB46BCB|nr:hypothetical protein [Paraburkholderia tropica]CAG9235817.1 conserved hypothetical protein [Paraburkholderia tropica]
MSAARTLSGHAGVQVRVGIPVTGGQLVAAARGRQYPVLFSANAFARTYPRQHERAGGFRQFSLPDPSQFDGLDAALDSAGFVAAARYGDYRWTVEDYYELVAAYPWTWHAAMDYCVEEEVARDRPMRLLRIAATAHMLGQCNTEARRRGLALPMPVLQGWQPDEYRLCAEWLPVIEWPALVGLGSVCRRSVHGPDGILAILDAIDRILPAHVRLHLFGVKSEALAILKNHPRVHSVDSMAWDFAARRARPTGRTMKFRIEQMQEWTERQRSVADQRGPGRGLQGALFDPCEFGGLAEGEAAVLEALAFGYAELVMSGDVAYSDAIWHARRDAVGVIALYRRGADPDEYDEIFPGMAEKMRAHNEE